MNIEVSPALITDKSLIQQMMELYQYDFSELENTDLNKHRYFGYSYQSIVSATSAVEVSCLWTSKFITLNS
jgi:hypothetical protein